MDRDCKGILGLLLGGDFEIFPHRIGFRAVVEFLVVVRPCSARLHLPKNEIPAASGFWNNSCR